MAAKEATEATLPFGMGSVDLTDPAMVVVTAISLIAGFTLFSMASDVGNNFASRINSALAGLIGFNPATGEGAGSDTVPGV